MQPIEKYLGFISTEQRTEFERIKTIVRKVVPDATETMAYGIPTFKYKGKNLLHFGAFKDHVSIFPGPKAIEILEDKLSVYKLSKGTIQYSATKPIPDDIVIELIKISISDITK